MAYINVAEWSPDQVTDWLKGLDNSMYHYINSFTNNEVRGQALLNIRPYELEQLGMNSIGHQEIVLDAVEHLRNFHYHLDKENLQFLALHVATTSQCLHNQLAHFDDKSKIETQILSDVTRTIATIKPLIAWLDRSPFQGKQQFVELRNKMFIYAIEMAMSAQRDRFVENPVVQIKKTALSVAKLANYIIQDISDPMILQPASLNLVTIKKKESELGFNIVPNYHGIHVVTDIKYNSPAHTSGKIEDGDEIIQINYQTVVGWQYKKVIHQLNESPPDILITLKKRPKHTKVYGQIYMKPYRLPSKKKSQTSRWGDGLPSPRTDLLPIQDFQLPLTTQDVTTEKDDFDFDCADDILIKKKPSDTDSDKKEIRLYLPTARAPLQRRNTICGDQVSGFKNNILIWHEHKKGGDNSDDSPSLRDKSVSFGFGLETVTRPITHLGIPPKFNDFSGFLKGSLPEMSVENEKPDGSEAEPTAAISKPGISKVVRFDSTKSINEYKDSIYTCNVDDTILEVFEPIPYVDEDEQPMQKAIAEVSAKPNKSELTQAINEILVNKRNSFDKIGQQLFVADSSDDTDSDDIPPAIEPRKEFLHKIPPAPPPRPKKIVPPPLPPPVKLDARLESNELMTKLATNVPKIVENSLEQSSYKSSGSATKQIPATKHFLDECQFEELELLTPGKTKNLTLKKKNSIMAKRRNISLKTLEVSDIQGHLYRRSKDKHGVTYWAKLYVVLTDTSLYGFKTKESTKADCLIFLSGFTVSLANEVHSKPFAFKVYHPTKTFYFAAESQQALSQWMEYIKKATLKGNTNTMNITSNQNVKELYSETESSGDESDQQRLFFGGTPATSTTTLNIMRNGSQKKQTDDSAAPVKSEKYHLNFGSLKKFTKQNLPFSSNKRDKEKIQSSDVPQPTAQYRSYRKVPGNAGLQLGTSSMISSTGTADFSPPLLSAIDSSYTNDFPNRKASITSLHTTAPPTPTVETKPWLTPVFKLNKIDSKKLQKISPCNYIHASNPNLVEFDFPTSKTLDYSLPKVNPSNSWDAHHNLMGQMTLKDLMLKKQEEDAQEMYNNRVYLGVEKKTDKPNKRKHRTQSKASRTEDADGKPVTNKIQSRSLPKTPDYAQNFNHNDIDILMTRSKEGQKLRDFGYELISNDDPIDRQSGVSTSSSHARDHHRKNESAKKKGLNWMNSGGSTSASTTTVNGSDEKASRAGSFKKSKNKLVADTFESFKTSSEKLFQFKYTNNDKEMLQFNPKTTDKSFIAKPASSYSPLTLPLNKKSSHLYNINVEPGRSNHHDHPTAHQSNIKKSITYNTPADFRDGLAMENPRKTSAPSYFTKLNFTSNKSKEKKLLGSPRLHRALFGRRESVEHQQHLDHEKFSSVDSDRSKDFHETILPSPPSTSAQHKKVSLSTSAHTIGGTPEHPHLEYPPVFEGDTYPLSDPNTSLTLLRRRNHNQSK